MVNINDVVVVPDHALPFGEHAMAARRYMYFGDGPTDGVQVLEGTAPFGKRVRYLVKALVGSYGKAAEYLNSGVPGANYTEPYIHKIASRPNKPTDKTIWKLAAGFRIDRDFFNSTDEEEMARYVYRARNAALEYFYPQGSEDMTPRTKQELADMTDGELWGKLTVLRREEEQILDILQRRYGNEH